MEDQRSKIKDQSHNPKIKTISHCISFTLCIVALHFAFYALSSNKAHADSIGLSVSPSLIKIEAIPPSDPKIPIMLENQANKPLDINILLRPFRASEKDNGEIEYLVNNKISDSYKRIINKVQITDNGIATSHFELGPQQKKNLEFNISLPKDEAYSDYYFSIVFLAHNNELDYTAQPSNNLTIKQFNNETIEQQSNFSVVNAGITVNVLLSIIQGADKNIASGYIEEFSAPLYLQSGPVPFTIRIKNIAKHVLAPKGIIFIKNMFGQNIGRVDLESVNILAGATRYFTNSQTISSLSAGQFSFPKAIWQERFLLGPYTATLNLALTEKGPILNKSVVFMALPIQLVIGIIFSLFIIIFILLRIKNRLETDK